MFETPGSAREMIKAISENNLLAYKTGYIDGFKAGSIEGYRMGKLPINENEDKVLIKKKTKKENKD